VLARFEDKWVYYKYDGWKNLCALLNCLLNDRTKPQMAKNKSLFTLHNLNSPFHPPSENEKAEEVGSYCSGC